MNMCLVITFVSSWIAVYSLEYMENEEGIVRFFSTVNLFVCFMLLLVLADNLLLMFIGWEGVGLCSFILIGFYYKEPLAQKAAIKAFLTTRIGDAFLLLALIVCYLQFKTLDISFISNEAGLIHAKEPLLITLICFGLIGGAVGKSAQLPLQTWLADAMWGPTPVSALIHAATMVTAGVYLIARMSALFALSPEGMQAVLAIGALTLLFAGIIASLQTDLKKVLAYSTMSQIGFMFLALGVGAYDAAMFHLTTHAFFKALLFLAAGVIGHSIHSYDFKKMGSLKKQNPFLFWIFLIGCINLMGIPFISAGFFSKELILASVHHDANTSWAYGLALVGVFFTGYYSLRMIKLTFFGKKENNKCHMGIMMKAPLMVLAFFSLVIGYAHFDDIIALLQHESVLAFLTPTIICVLGGLFGFKFTDLGLFAFLKQGGGFEWLYQKLIINPYVALSKKLNPDSLQALETIFIRFTNFFFGSIKSLHTGDLSSYISFLVVAALVMTGIMVI